MSRHSRDRRSPTAAQSSLRPSLRPSRLPSRQPSPQHRPGRAATPVTQGLRALLLVGLVAAPLGYAVTESTVTLDVDGQTRTVATHARTVGALLADQGVTVDARDLVAPGTDTPLADGLRVAVVNARPVQLMVDGRTQQVWTTAATVDQLTAELGQRFQAAYLTADRSTRIPLTGLELGVRLPKSVTVVADGRSRAVVTTAGDWAGVLTAAGITLGVADRSSQPLTGQPADGARFTVTRIGSRTQRASVPLAFATQTRSDATLLKGRTKVLSEGRPGRAVVTYRLDLVDGRVVKRTAVTRTVASQPRPRVVAVGTKVPPRPAATGGSGGGSVGRSGGLNWAALARCESGGNPRSVGGGGAYFGLYQFSLGTWRRVGGSGNPVDASPAEQTYRAQLLYQSSGTAPWPACGRLLFT